jgi:hypothetical protein
LTGITVSVRSNDSHFLGNCGYLNTPQATALLDE